ncbi:MAG: Trk system potassium transporter TrkA, partial [Nitrospinota bacterium]
MRIVIVGAGDVGSHIARRLAPERHDVVLVERDPEVAARATEELDAQVLLGNGADPNVLAQARIGEAQLLLAVGNEDAANLVACHIARTCGVPTRIARVEEMGYLSNSLGLDGSTFGADILINPFLEVARSIAELVETPGAMEATTFFKGQAKLVGLRVEPGSPVTGTPLREVGEALAGEFLFVGLDRAGELHIPRGDTTFEAGDLALAVARAEGVPHLLAACGKSLGEARRALVVGGGRVGYHLARLLLERGLEVKIFEADPRRCEMLADALPEALTLRADGTDSAALRAEEVERMDVVVAVTDHEETNLMSSLLAKQHGAPRAICLIKRPAYLPLFPRLGVDAVVSPRLVTAGVVLKHV